MLDIYARLSRAVNGETVQVDDQVELCAAKIHDRGGVLGESFKDNSLSAWNPKVVRPQWNQLMERLETGRSDGVMVYDLYRFSRKILEGERLVDLASRGVRVWALSGEYDLTTADGRRHFREAMVAAAGESDKTSERVKRGIIRRARKGRDHGGGRSWAMPGLAPRPPGWETGDPRVRAPDSLVQAERAIAREAIERLSAGGTLASLVRELNARGAAGEPGCLPVSGKPWGGTGHSLVKTLQRPAMAGLLAMHGEIIGELTGVHPIVSREDWERLCALFASRKTGRPPSPRHLLSGVIACECGRRLRAWLRTGRRPYPDGEAKREYVCQPSSEGEPGCGRNSIDGRAADDAVAHAVVQRLGDPRRAERMASQLARVGQQRAQLEDEITRWESNADQLAMKTVAWGIDRVDAAMRPILDQVDRLRAELASLGVPESAAEASADAISVWNAARQRGDIAAQRKMIRSAFPYLTLAARTRRGDNGPHRLLWDGPKTRRLM